MGAPKVSNCGGRFRQHYTRAVVTEYYIDKWVGGGLTVYAVEH